MPILPESSVQLTYQVWESLVNGPAMIEVLILTAVEKFVLTLIPSMYKVHSRIESMLSVALNMNSGVGSVVFVVFIGSNKAIVGAFKSMVKVRVSELLVLEALSTQVTFQL